MKTATAITVILVTGVSSRVEATNFALITSPPTLLNLAVLLLAAAGVVVGLQLLKVMKGGFLCRAWQVLVAGFGVLVLGQASILVQTFEIAALPVWVTPALTVIWAGIFFYGVFETKRILS